MLTLHDYQKDALDFALKTRNPFIVMKMGLGKTAVALKFIEAIGRPALVLGPLTPILNTWPEEINKWTPNLTYTILHGKDKNQKFYLRKDITLLNFEGLKNYYQQCLRSSQKLRKHILIVDESTMLKDPSTTRFKLMEKLLPLFLPVRLFLSATPVDEGIIGLWSQMFLLDNGRRLGKSYWNYRQKYFVETGPPRFIVKELPGATKEVANKVKDICFAMENKGYFKEPKLIPNLIPINLPSKVLERYKTLSRDFVLKFSDDIFAIARSENTLVNKLRQFVSGAMYTTDGGVQVVHQEKLKALKDTLIGLDGRNTLVAINFRFEVDLIRKTLGYRVPVLHGGVSANDKVSLIREWNQKKLKVLLCHPNSISHGLNLQAGGNSIIWYTLPWGRGPYEQLMGRLARQGQVEDFVVAHHLMVKDTIDYDVMRGLQRKGKDGDKFFNWIQED